jgi:hypothetical protein
MTLDENKKLKEELNVHGLSLEDQRILLSILKTIREIGYESQKIVREISRIKSLRQTERFGGSYGSIQGRVTIV